MLGLIADIKSAAKSRDAVFRETQALEAAAVSATPKPGSVQRKRSFKGAAKGVVTGIKINDAIELNNFGADLFGRIDAAKVDSDMVEAIERTPHLAAGPGVDIELESLGWNDSEAGDDEFGFEQGVLNEVADWSDEDGEN